MFIFNVKVNGSKLFKVFFTFVIILMIIILCTVFYKVISGSNKSFSVSDNLDSSGVCKISAKNYANILKTVHENVDSYVGKKINFTGYVYRVSDLQDNQFVLARNMIINSSSQSVSVIVQRILLMILGLKLLVRLLKVHIMVICLLLELLI